MDGKRLPLKKLREHEYETQHFGFSSQAVIDVVRGVLMDNVSLSVDTLSSKIIEHMKGTTPDEVTAAAGLLLKEYEEEIKELPQAWEVMVERHFRIPSHVLLEEDEPQRQQFSATEASAMDEELASLTRRAKRAALLDSFLTMRLETVDKLSRKLEEFEARLGDERETRDLEHTVASLVENVRTFNAMARDLGGAQLQHHSKEEANSYLRQKDYLVCD